MGNNTNLQARGTYIEEYDFYVDDETAYHITYGNYESYTFAINRDQDNILISPAGGFAMRIDDKDKMQAALQLLEPIAYDDYGSPIDSPDMLKLKQDYNEKVIKPCGDTDNACFKEKFKTFIYTFTLSNGDGLGISYYEATFDANDNITNWKQQ